MYRREIVLKIVSISMQEHVLAKKSVFIVFVDDAVGLEKLNRLLIVKLNTRRRLRIINKTHDVDLHF